MYIQKISFTVIFEFDMVLTFRTETEGKEHPNNRLKIDKKKFFFFS